MAVTFFEQGVEKGIEKGIEKGMEKGMEKGIEKGIEQGKRDLIKQILEDRFGAVPRRVSQVIDNWPEKSLSRLARLAGEINSIAEVVKLAKQ